MRVNHMQIEIDNFENAAMVEGRSFEVARMLREVASVVEQYGVPHTDGGYLMDSNGNRVGIVSVDWEEGENGE